MRICLPQAYALFRAHRAVVEVEVQVADAGVLRIGDLAVRVVRGWGWNNRHGDLRHVEWRAGESQRAFCRQLEVPLESRVLSLEVCDPDGAVDSRAAYRAGLPRDDLARLATQDALRMCAKQVEMRAVDRVEYAWMSLAGADLAHDRIGAVEPPVDRANRLAHQRPRAAGDGKLE